MKVTNKTFDNLRLAVEILGYVLTFMLAVSEIFGFKYGTEAAAASAALMTCLGSVVTALRNSYNKSEDTLDELD